MQLKKLVLKIPKQEPLNMRLRQEDQPYVPAAATDILQTFRRLGWTPPSEDLKTQEKWSYYKKLPQLSEEAVKL